MGVVMYLSQLNRFHIEVTIVLPELSYLPSYSRAVSDTTILYTLRYESLESSRTLSPFTLN